MTIRSRAPLRLGLGGGGTDVSPYSDTFEGCTLNATIDLYAYCTLSERKQQGPAFIAQDLKQKSQPDMLGRSLPLDGPLKLHHAVYNRIIKDFNEGQDLNIELETFCEVPPGSGLGSSSTMVVAQLVAYREYLKLPLDEYALAKLAHDIERKDSQLAGGKQDQYAATFGGWNFTEFKKNDQVIVNPLKVKSWIINEVEMQMILFYSGQSRESSQIIAEQIANTKNNNLEAIESMHQLKRDAQEMKDSLLTGKIEAFAELLGKSWNAKKKMAKGITNDRIDSIYDIAMQAGAYSGKVSGAGGGGFLLFMVPPQKRLNVIAALNECEGQVTNFHFTSSGAEAWRK